MSIKWAKKWYNINRLLNTTLRRIALNDNLVQMKFVAFYPWIFMNLLDICLPHIILWTSVWVRHVCQRSSRILEINQDHFQDLGHIVLGLLKINWSILTFLFEQASIRIGHHQTVSSLEHSCLQTGAGQDLYKESAGAKKGNYVIG